MCKEGHFIFEVILKDVSCPKNFAIRFTCVKVMTKICLFCFCWDTRYSFVFVFQFLYFVLVADLRAPVT